LLVMMRPPSSWPSPGLAPHADHVSDVSRLTH
jgi:hypothetical protein